MMCALVNLPFTVLNALLVVVELVVSQLPVSHATAGADNPKVLERGPKGVVEYMRGVLGLVLWGAGEH